MRTARQSSIRVLIIEDDPDDVTIIRDLISDQLQSPFELLPANCLRQGLEIVRSTPVQLVLLDLSLPDSTGIESVSVINNADANAAIVVLTGNADEKLAIEALTKGAQDYLVKGDITGNLLLRSMRHAIERQRLLTALRHQQIRLRESEERFRQLISENADGIVVVDDRGITRFANRAAEKLFGQAKDEIEGVPFVFPILGIKTELSLNGGDDTPTTVEMSVVEITSEGKQQNLLSLRDITERKAIEEKLRVLNEELERRVAERTSDLAAANSELEAFSYSVSHDLRAPLRGIDGFSEVLLTEYYERLDDQGRHYLRRIRRATAHMGELIDDILQLSKITRAQVKRVAVDLSRLATEIVEELRESCPNRDVGVVIHPGLTAEADRDLTRVLLENLLGNAWKFTGKNAAATIEFGESFEESGKSFFIRDNGAGFDMNYADKLFSPFQRLHRFEDFEGTGVGLATCQRIVRRHGGRIRARGEVNAGATFYFSL